MGIDSRAGSTGDVKDNDSAMNLKEIFRTVQTILLIDWPSKELPETLTRAGFHVVVRGGPGPEDYSAYELDSCRNLADDPGEVVVRHIGRAPERADLIYSYRPLRELPEIITTAKRLGAKTIWTQSGLSAAGVNDPKGCWVPEEALRQARDLVESAGLCYISEPYIGDAAQR
jgi:sugar phosphate isomerase/epimerase